jgi:hypothetical protein
MSHRWGCLAVLMLNFLIDHCLYGIIHLILILSVRPGLRCIMWSVLQFSCHAWFLFCVYIYICKQYWKSVPTYCLLAIYPQAKCPHAFFIGKVSPCILYWQSVPMHILLAKCPHAFCIGKLSPCIFYWQSVPIYFLSFGIFGIVKHSSHTALGICFLFFPLFFSPFSFLLFVCLFFLFLLQARHGSFMGYSSIGQLSSPLRLRAHLCAKVLKMCQ